MLSHISIRHYALIDKLEIDLSKGLNILTGETGSGKSIILGALGLILGERADRRSVMPGKKKCIVEASFLLDKSRWKHLFEKNDLDFDEVSIFRREVLASGKSRAFINDTPINLKFMRELGLNLVDIHSQHQTIRLNNPDFQRDLIDAFAGTTQARKQYQADFREYTELRRKLGSLKEEIQRVEQEKDFISFQLGEFEALRLEDIDEAELENNFNLLSNGEEIVRKLGSSLYALRDGETPVLTVLAEIRDNLEDLRTYSKSFDEFFLRLKSAIIELSDLAEEIESSSSEVNIDPNRLMEITELRSALYRLQQKHGVNDLEGLKSRRGELEEQISATNNLEREIEELETVLARKRKDIIKFANELSSARQEVLETFSREIEDLLKMLNMKKASFGIGFERLKEPTDSGIDKFEMRFSANAGRPPESIKRIASGGELSRLMLAIKKISATPDQTIILDEIDSGVSGEVANSMGKIIKEMGMKQPVICITHLPQIASKGQAHFKVYKSDDLDITETRIVRLTEEDRIEEIAQMLSGSKMTSSARENARELLLSE